MGCHLPMMHPIRLREGPWIAAAASFQVADGARGSCDIGGCRTTPEPGVYLSFPQVAAGYAHLFTPNVGFSIGGQLLTMRDQRMWEWYAGTSLLFFGVVQSDELAIGGGFEVGVGSLTLELATEVELVRFDRDWALSVAAFARRTIPWDESPPSGPLDGNPRVWSYDVGGRVSLGMVFLQYSYFRLDRGIVMYELFESLSFMEGLHVVTIGMNGSFFERPE